MHLQAALGVSLMFTRGGSDAAGVALNRSFAIAEQRGDALDQLRLLGPLNMFYLRTGDFKNALYHAKRCSAISRTLDDAVAAALAHSILGMSLHLSGDLKNARTELEAALRRESGARRTTTVYLGFESRSLAGAILARNLWLQGFPDQAVARACQTIDEAVEMDHSLTLAIALIWGISVFLWAGDLQRAEANIDRLIAHAETNSLLPYLAVGRGFAAEMAICRSDASGGVETLQGCLGQLHAMPYELLGTHLAISLVQGLVATGRFIEGGVLIDETIQRVKVGGDAVYMPELLRLKGSLLQSMPEPRAADAEAYFLQSLALSRNQGACAFEMRAAGGLAALYAGQGQPERGKAILQPVFEQIEAGSDTTDVKAAERLLATLG
jgi:tetratricopeptide (TPR) repeat protein